MTTKRYEKDASHHLEAGRQALLRAVTALLKTDQIAVAQGVLALVFTIKDLSAQKGIDIIDGLSTVERDYARAGQKISAIKEHRSRTGMGLKESKDEVEAFMSKHGYQSAGF